MDMRAERLIYEIQASKYATGLRGPFHFEAWHGYRYPQRPDKYKNIDRTTIRKLPQKAKHK